MLQFSIMAAIPIYVTDLGRMQKQQNFPATYSGTDRIVGKRGGKMLFHVYFLDSAKAKYLHAASTTVKVGCKLLSAFDTSSFVVSGSTTTTPASADDPYVIEVSTNTVALNAALAVNGDDSDDVAYVDLSFEISWTEPLGVPESTLDPVTIRIHNDVIRDDEGVPIEADPAYPASTDVVAYTDQSGLAKSDAAKAQARKNIGIPKANYSASTPPTATDDVSEDYSVGSVWADTAGNETYRCVDATEGAAVWIESTFDGAEVAALIGAITITDLGVAAYADLAAANAALDIGDVYWDTGAARLRVATA